MVLKLSRGNNKEIFTFFKVHVPLNKVRVIDNRSIIVIHDTECNFEAILVQVDDVFVCEEVFCCFDSDCRLLSEVPLIQFLKAVSQHKHPHDY
jgi:hypothetical protein